MKKSAARFLPASLRAATVLFCAAAVFAAAGEDKFLTYHSPEVGCDWLSIEYDTIKSWAERDEDEDRPIATPEGVMMTFGMVLTAPLALFGGLFGKKKQRLDFSRDADDLAVAAAKKKCGALLAQMEADKRAGKYPHPGARS